MNFVNPLYEDKRFCEKMLYTELFDPSARQLIRKVVRLVGDCEGKKVLDIGCGTGVILNEFDKNGAHCMGIDHSQTMINLVRYGWPSFPGWPNSPSLYIGRDIEVRWTDIADFDLESFGMGRQDIILCIEFLEHIRGDEEILRKIHSMLKDDGFLIITTPVNTPLETGMKIKGHVRHYSFTEMEDKLSSAGFEIAQVQVPVAILSRLWPIIKKSGIMHRLSYSSKVYRWLFMPFGDLLFKIDTLLNKFISDDGIEDRSGHLILKAVKA